MPKKATNQVMPLLPDMSAFPKYLRPIVERIGGRYSYVGEISHGKTGIAYKLRSNTNEHLCFCMKTIREEVKLAKDRADVRENLIKESEILKPLSHRCLPTIYEQHFEGNVPYYICTYHPGVTFAEFRENGNTCTFQNAINIIWSLTDTLRYLHDNGRTHCDLHSRNIMIGEHVARDGIMIIDFGSGHRLSDSSPETKDRGNVGFKSFAGARNDRKPGLRSALHSRSEGYDFVALGKLLATMADCFMNMAPTPSKRAYEELSKALVHEQINSWQRVEEGLFAVIDPFRAASANMDIFLSEEGIPQTIIVPGIAPVPVGQPSLAIINTAVFQTLRGVRQLSFCDWLFPGATHTRFEHSLGVFSVAKRAIDCLIHDSSFRTSFTALDVRGFLLAALIHDVGHYPFAHVIEQYVAGRFPGNREARQLVSHEAHVREILDSESELVGVLSECWGTDAVLQAKKTLDGQKGSLSRLIDGPIDVDKIDYLTRDAAHCGVRYGGGLEIELLLRSLTCVNNNEDIGVTEEGVPAVEGLMILQNQMLSQVYWNAEVRGLIAMFHAILAHLVGTDIQKLQSLEERLKKCQSDADGFTKVLIPDIKAFPGPEQKQLEQLILAFANPRYNQVYRPVRTYRSVDPAHPRMMMNVYNVVLNSSSQSHSEVPIEWNAVGRLRSAYMKAFEEKSVEVSKLDVVIDVPYGKDSRRMVKIKTRDSQTEIEIPAVSHLKETAFTQPAVHLSPVRVYISPAVYAKAESRLPSIIESAEERFA